MSTKNTKPSHPRVDLTDQAVYLTEILPHDVNYGYETWKGSIAIAVNGKSFSNVKGMKALVDSVESGIIEIEVLGAPSIILDMDVCKDTDAILREQYNLHTTCSIDLQELAPL